MLSVFYKGNVFAQPMRIFLYNFYSTIEHFTHPSAKTHNGWPMTGVRFVSAT